MHKIKKEKVDIFPLNLPVFSCEYLHIIIFRFPQEHDYAANMEYNLRITFWPSRAAP